MITPKLLTPDVSDEQGAQPSQPDEELIAKFIKAFGMSAAVYFGGPDRQDEGGAFSLLFLSLHPHSPCMSHTPILPIYRHLLVRLGLLVHGVPDLEGASEIAPGLRIYTGGEEAAIDAVLDGRCSPLDFRWFVGRTEGVSTVEGSWLAVACARPVALKQCLGLPKPLWHEVTLSLPTVSPYICHAPFFRMHHPHSFLCTTRIVLSMLTTRRSWSSVAASPQHSASSSYSSGRSEL